MTSPLACRVAVTMQVHLYCHAQDYMRICLNNADCEIELSMLMQAAPVMAT